MGGRAGEWTEGGTKETWNSSSSSSDDEEPLFNPIQSNPYPIAIIIIATTCLVQHSHSSSSSRKSQVKAKGKERRGSNVVSSCRHGGPSVDVDVDAILLILTTAIVLSRHIAQEGPPSAFSSRLLAIENRRQRDRCQGQWIQQRGGCIDVGFIAAAALCP